MAYMLRNKQAIKRKFTYKLYSESMDIYNKKGYLGIQALVGHIKGNFFQITFISSLKQGLDNMINYMEKQLNFFFKKMNRMI